MTRWAGFTAFCIYSFIYSFCTQREYIFGYFVSIFLYQITQKVRKIPVFMGKIKITRFSTDKKRKNRLFSMQKVRFLTPKIYTDFCIKWINFVAVCFPVWNKNRLERHTAPHSATYTRAQYPAMNSPTNNAVSNSQLPFSFYYLYSIKNCTKTDSPFCALCRIVLFSYFSIDYR